jgi:hypothetical protein
LKSVAGALAALALVAAAQQTRAQDAWVSAAVPDAAAARFDIGALRSENISASIGSGKFFVTDLGTAPSGVFRRIRNGGVNAIPFVMDGKRIVGYAPSSPVGGPGGSGGSNVLPVAPGEVVEFVSLGGGSWQLVQYLPLRMQNFGLQPNWEPNNIPPTHPAPDNWFQLGPVAGKGPEPDYPFAVNWTLHGGKVHTHGLYLMLPGDTPNIELRQADIDPKDEGPRPWTHAPWYGAHVSGRPMVDIGGGTYAFLNNEQPGTVGYRQGPSFLYQGFSANIVFPITQPPTRAGTGGALLFKVTPNDTITPFQRGWFSNTGNFVEIGKAAFEACHLAYPYAHPGPMWKSDSPCDDADYFDTPGWGNLSVVATDVGDPKTGHNAAIAIRKFKAHGEGLDIAYDASAGTIDRYGVHEDRRTAVETFDPARNVFTYPTKPAFQAGLGADVAAATGDGQAFALRFDKVALDQGRNFDAGSGAFTAPVSGPYQLQVTVELSGVSPDNGGVSLDIVAGGRTYVYEPGRLRPDADGRVSLHYSVLAPLQAGQTARAVVRVGGARRTVAVLAGTAEAPRSTFSGFFAG